MTESKSTNKFTGKVACRLGERVLLAVSLSIVLLSTSPGNSSGSPDSGILGVIVMAHGGGPEWNRAVKLAVAPLRVFCPAVVAFGMAHPDSLQQAINKLEAVGVEQIAVVRLFISSNSFRHQTEYLLGLRPDPPAMFVQHHVLKNPEASDSSGNSATKAHEDEKNFQHPLHIRANVVMNEDGLADDPDMGEVLADRAGALSADPRNESVLILAHGAGSEYENDLWLTKMDSLATKVRELGPFRMVRVETLREDWKDKRKAAEERIRDFVETGNREGGRVLVLPFRVFGLGPYRKVLDGLNYMADTQGLLPHPIVTEWLKDQASSCFVRANSPNPFDEEWHYSNSVQSGKDR